MIAILHTDGDYRIVQHDPDSNGGYALEHRCKHFEKDYEKDYGGSRGWQIFVWLVEARGWRCEMCKGTASDGLQVAFWFLKEAK